MANVSVSLINDGGTHGVLKRRAKRSSIVLNFATGNGRAEEFEVYASMSGFGININVRAGEKQSSQLRNDFVVSR